MEEEFTIFQLMDMRNFPKGEVDVVSIRVDEKENKIVYPIDVIWYQLYLMKGPGLSRSKF